MVELKMKDEKHYVGSRVKEGVSVCVCCPTKDDGNTMGYVLEPRHSQKVLNHSPDGFEWGYGGSGPAQLALAILMDCFEKDKEVPVSKLVEWHQEFKKDFIQNSDRHDLSVWEDDIRLWVMKQHFGEMHAERKLDR